jgi:DNA-binding MarR family transcriptional regulator
MKGRAVSDQPHTGASQTEVDEFLVASRVLVGVAATSLADADEITFPQFRALVVLSTAGHATVGHLAQALDIHPSTATRLCDRLVRKRLVRRARARTDRRETDVILTAEGRRVVEQVLARRRRAITAVLDRMSPDDRAAARAALAAFSAAAGERAPTDPFAWGTGTQLSGDDGATGPTASARGTGLTAGAR